MDSSGLVLEGAIVADQARRCGFEVAIEMFGCVRREVDRSERREIGAPWQEVEITDRRLGAGFCSDRP